MLRFNEEKAFPFRSMNIHIGKSVYGRLFLLNRNFHNSRLIKNKTEVDAYGWIIPTRQRAEGQ